MQINSDLLRLMSMQTTTATSSSSSALAASSDSKATQDAVKTVNQSDLLGYDRELRFSKDSKSNVGVVQVLDRSSGQVILQIPSKFIINLAESLQSTK